MFMNMIMCKTVVFPMLFLQANIQGPYGRFLIQFVPSYRDLVKSKDPKLFFNDKAMASRAYGLLEETSTDGVCSWTLTVRKQVQCGPTICHVHASFTCIWSVCPDTALTTCNTLPFTQVMLGHLDVPTTMSFGVPSGSGGSGMQHLASPGFSGSMKKVAKMIAKKMNKKDRKKSKRVGARVSDKRLMEMVLTGLHSFVPRACDTGLFLKGGHRSKPKKTEEYVVSGLC